MEIMIPMGVFFLFFFIQAIMITACLVKAIAAVDFPPYSSACHDAAASAGRWIVLLGVWNTTFIIGGLIRVSVYYLGGA